MPHLIRNPLFSRSPVSAEHLSCFGIKNPGAVFSAPGLEGHKQRLMTRGTWVFQPLIMVSRAAAPAAAAGGRLV